VLKAKVIQANPIIRLLNQPQAQLKR